MTITALSLLAGAIVTVGLLVIVAAFRPAPGPDLVAALEVVSGRTSSVAENVDQTRIGRIGRSVTRTFHVSVSPAMRAALRLQGTTWLPLWRWCRVAPQASPRTSTRPGSGG